MRACRADVLLVLDQAYAEYLAPEDDDGALALADAHSNVLVTRTFSKIYGLAGERIGWATGAPGLIARSTAFAARSTSSNRAGDGTAALGDQAFVEQFAPTTMPQGTRALCRAKSRRWAIMACARCRARRTSCWSCSKAR
jgi:histidinol-phosphate aminotransferase